MDAGWTGLDDRLRQLVKIEGWIVRAEHALRDSVWDVSADDAVRRLFDEQVTARRREQFADSAARAAARRLLLAPREALPPCRWAGVWCSMKEVRDG